MHHSHFLIVVRHLGTHLLRNSRLSDHAPRSDLGHLDHLDRISSNHPIRGDECKLGFWISVSLFINTSRFQNSDIHPSLMSRFFLNLRSVAYDNPLIAAHATTGFALDNTSPRGLMMKILRRNPANQNAQGTLEDTAIRRRMVEGDVIDISGGRTSVANIDPEAGREMVELRTTGGQSV